MEMFRSILLADLIGNIFVRAHRLANLGALASDLPGEHSWQCGGVPGVGTEFPVLAIRLLQEKAKAAGTFIALIFVDAGQACYAIIRKLVLSVGPIHQQSIQRDICCKQGAPKNRQTNSLEGSHFFKTNISRSNMGHAHRRNLEDDWGHWPTRTKDHPWRNQIRGSPIRNKN